LFKNALKLSNGAKKEAYRLISGFTKGENLSYRACVDFARIIWTILGFIRRYQVKIRLLALEMYREK
jgi:hypothetical protein